MCVLSFFIDENQDLAIPACNAKSLANDCYRLITDEAVQMHGGIGLTDEMDIGFYLKRIKILIYIEIVQGVILGFIF